MKRYGVRKELVQAAYQRAHPKRYPKPTVRKYYQPPSLESREYQLFKKRREHPRNWYEHVVNRFGNVITMTPEKGALKRMRADITFTELRVTPDQVMGSMILMSLLFLIFGGTCIALGILPILPGIVATIAGFPLGFYLYKYPGMRVKAMRIQASSQVVLAILYMVVSMRISLNLERAFRFAAANISGALAVDMRRLIWDIELGRYHSARQALDTYVEKWKSENEEFSESLRLIKNAEEQTVEKSQLLLDQALESILEGTKTRMKHYAQDMRMPVMVIHMMGIVLPILGSIMAPLAAVFLSDLVTPWHFVLGYDIVLPIMLVWFIANTLNKRPVTFSQVDISDHPSLPKPGSFRVKGKDVPASLIAIVAAAALIVPSVWYFVTNPEIFFQGVADREFTMTSIIMSGLMILGIAVGISVYSILSTFQRVRLKDNIEKTESQFELALFQLGHRVSGGTPIEVAVEKALDDVKDLEISKFFKITLRNIRTLGMTFEQAIFDKQYGTLRFYPSRLLRNVMYTVTDTARKGVQYASESALRISRYLKNIRETQEYIRDLLEETSSSMKFQAYFLTPLITGLIVSIADVIVKVLVQLGAYLDTIGLNDEAGFGNVSGIFGNLETSVSPEIFQLIVGIYLIEVVMILGYFLTKISRGDDSVNQWYLTGKMLLLSVIIYFIVAVAASMVFGDLIRSALAGLGVGL